MAKVSLVVTKKRVRALIKQYPHLRDDDERLIANIWYQDMLTMGYSDEQARVICKVVSEGNLTNPESIRRSRQQLQKDEEILRGEKYEARHGNQRNIKSQL